MALTVFAGCILILLSIPPPYGRTTRVWDSLLVSLGVWEVGGSRPSRGNSKGSFSFCKETAKVFSSEMPFYSKF